MRSAYFWLALGLLVLIFFWRRARPVFGPDRPGPIIGPDRPDPIILGNDPLAFDDMLNRAREENEAFGERLRVDLDKIRRLGMNRDGMRANIAASLGGDYQTNFDRTANLSNEDLSKLWVQTPEGVAFVARQQEEEQPQQLQIGGSGHMVFDAD